MSSSRAISASAIGGSTPASAASRKRRRRAPTSRGPRRHRSNEIVPATDTISPEAVDRNAANAPAATSAPSSSPPSPGHAASGSASTTVSVSPVMYSSRHQHAPERAVDHGERVEQRQQAEHAHGRAPRRRPVRVGVEAHEDVRQAHRAQERRQQQRVDEHGRGAPLAGHRARPLRAGLRVGPLGHRHDGAPRQHDRAGPDRALLALGGLAPAARRRVYAVAAGNVTGWGLASSTVRPEAGARGSSWPNSAARSGSPPRWIRIRHAGSAIANVFVQYWNACT